MTITYTTAQQHEANLAAAVQAVADAEAAAVSSDAAVNRAREQLALGHVSRGGLLAIQKANGRAIEQVAQCQAAVRALEKLAVAAREEVARQERLERQRAAAAAAAIADEIDGKLGVWLERVQREFADFDRSMYQASVAASSSLAPRPAPSATRPGRELIQALRAARQVWRVPSQK